MNVHAAVFVGGAAGALARYGLTELLPQDDPTAWPWAIFIANILGSAILGILAARFTVDHVARPLLGTGFCGAFTTFSTFQFELTELATGTAVLYATASIAIGLAAVLLWQEDGGRVALIAGIALLGGVGALARFAVGLRWPGVPGTFIVQITPAFALGVLHAAGVTGDALTLSAGAFLGSYTTFSTWMLETTDLPLARAAMNIAIPFAAGLVAVLLPTLA